MVPRMFSAILTVLILAAGPGLGHEFWIEPSEYQVESGAPLVAELRNGQNFLGVSLAFFENRIVRFELVQAGRAEAVTGRMGDAPALQTTAPGDGLLVILHQTAPSTLKYTEWEKFLNFVEHKDFADVPARHRARGLPETGFTEIYTRYAKALVGVDGAAGSDAVSGMETEFVALANPYTDDLTAGFPVQLLYQGTPRGDAQVEIFERPPEGDVVVTLTRTDKDGRAKIPVKSDHVYLLDAVVLRPAPEGSKPVWESLWAALTFAVP